SFADKNAGVGKTVSVTGISFSGADAGNYTFNSSASATATITPAPVTPQVTAANKVYDGTNTATITSRTLVGVFGSDAVTLTGGTATFNNVTVGNAKTVIATGLTLTGADVANYQLTATAAATAANITPATPVITFAV